VFIGHKLETMQGKKQTPKQKSNEKVKEEYLIARGPLV